MKSEIVTFAKNTKEIKNTHQSKLKMKNGLKSRCCLRSNIKMTFPVLGDLNVVNKENVDFVWICDSWRTKQICTIPKCVINDFRIDWNRLLNWNFFENRAHSIKEWVRIDFCENSILLHTVNAHYIKSENKKKLYVCIIRTHHHRWIIQPHELCDWNQLQKNETKNRMSVKLNCNKGRLL